MAAPIRQSVPLEGKINKKIKDLKIELLKSPTKRGRVKKEIARLLTMANSEDTKLKIDDKEAEKTNNKPKEGKK